VSEVAHHDDEASRREARRYLEETVRTISGVTDACTEDIAQGARVLTASLRSGGKVLICGNGGSAADAQHLATELLVTFTRDRLRPSIPALALTTDTSVLTAVANDLGADRIFARQVESLGSPGDALIAISTSGTSSNVLAAVEEARSRGLAVVALTGASGGKLATMADVAIRVPSELTAHVQEAHLAIEHLLASLIEARLHPVGT
jgi:D-sedoheptulose 7-phosphate isomerase